MQMNQNLVGGTLIGIGLIAIMAAGPISEFSKSDPVQPPDTRTACKVLTVYDGDTVGCDLNGNGKIEQPEEQIRLLGLDSPEMHYSRKNPTHGSDNPTDEPFAAEASQWLESRTLRRTIYLEFDQHPHDKYNRTLAYAYLSATDTSSLNEQLLAAGLAQTLFIGNNRRHEERFRQAEAKARQSRKGLWGK